MEVLYLIIPLIIAVVIVIGVLTPHYRNRFLRGPVNPGFICPHCREQGNVRVKAIRSGEMSTVTRAMVVAVTTAAMPWATGPNKKNPFKAYCSSCKSTWYFEDEG